MKFSGIVLLSQEIAHAKFEKSITGRRTHFIPKSMNVTFRLFVLSQSAGWESRIRNDEILAFTQRTFLGRELILGFPAT